MHGILQRKQHTGGEVLIACRWDGRTIVPDKAHRRDDPGTGDGDSGTRRPRPRELGSLSPPGRSSLFRTGLGCGRRFPYFQIWVY